MQIKLIFNERFCKGTRFETEAYSAGSASFLRIVGSEEPRVYYKQ